MPEKMRARHEVFGVKDVLDNDYYRSNGWVKVDPSTPTSDEERVLAENEVRRGRAPVVEYAAGAYDPADHTVSEVQEYLASADETERERVLDAERSGQARKTLVGDD